MKNIVIIGATSSIAEHCARLWASRGENMFLVARNQKRLEIVVADLKIRGANKIKSLSMDLIDLDQHLHLLRKLQKELNGIDIVLIAHGHLPDQNKCQNNANLTISEIQTNALSVISLMTHISEKLILQRSGSIGVISSVAGDRGRSSNYVYGSAKAMVTTFASGLRQRLYKFGVSVTTIKPAYIDTPMTSQFEKGLLWTSPSKAALQIVKAIDEKKNEVYVPKFWWWIMTIIRLTPSFIYNRLKL